MHKHHLGFIMDHRRMRRGGSCPPPPNSGKQWVKFGQTVGEIRAKQEEKIGQRKLQITPFGMWMMTSHRQCPRGGGCLWMSKSRGVFQILGVWMTSRGQCPRGGGACGYLCKISGKSTPLPPLTKAFSYAYVMDCDKYPTECWSQGFPIFLVIFKILLPTIYEKTHILIWGITRSSMDNG